MVRLTRRNLILGVAAALGLDPPGGLLLPAERANAADGVAESQLEDLVAFAEVLVGDGPLPEGERAYLVDHIVRRTQQGDGYYLALYTRTAEFVDRLARTRFATLDFAQRVALITRHRLFASRVQPGENLGAFPDAAREVRMRAVPDLIGGYYASPAGWAAVGYDTFPGRCGDLARYTSPDR